MITCPTPTVRSKAHAYLCRVTDLPPAIRKVCCYCPVHHEMDGLGPIQSTDIVSHGMCTAAFQIQMDMLDRREGGQ